MGNDNAQLIGCLAWAGGVIYLDLLGSIQLDCKTPEMRS